MDKLRSLHYFVAAAEAGSFAGAARRHGVSVAAVAKLIATLERHVGIPLFERHARGLALTAAGRHYLEACRPALAQLAAADEQVVTATSQARGTVVVGIQPVIAQECLTAALPRFRSMYPDIELDVRYFMRVTVEQTRGVDVFLIMGWPEAGDLVQRHIGATSFVVCAAPSYWARHGMPRHPSELERHNCLCIRGNTGTVMDLWHFKRGEERVSVSARGWLVVDNAHRDMVRDVALAGGGVARLLDWHKRPGREIASGALVPALVDWEQTEVPPVNLLYPPSVRRIPRVRLFMDFVTQVFLEIEQQREQHAPSTATPRWLKAKRLRASHTHGGEVG
ncbi:LysR family transcriptional regulator [Cupriavidus basilensis]|uniref:LysR family transcriptional regulator n=1 Tax=Cupriavidus basilensis TaxID=68895 RepID=A0ABT6B0W0_9BURK|nr:LysR family transcriptional regulator [Cupriavidus basilensis]MDF3837596.1 LysR family transcriptional regulator [Cupriavidus basilensis]